MKTITSIFPLASQKTFNLSANAIVCALSLILLMLFLFFFPRIYSQNYIGWESGIVNARCVADAAGTNKHACGIKITSLGDGREQMYVENMRGNAVLLHYDFQDKPIPPYFMLRIGDGIYGQTAKSVLVSVKKGDKSYTKSVHFNKNDGGQVAFSNFSKRAYINLSAFGLENQHTLTVKIRMSDKEHFEGNEPIHLVLYETGFNQNIQAPLQKGWMHVINRALPFVIFLMGVLAYRKEINSFTLLLFILSFGLFYQTMGIWQMWDPGTLIDPRVFAQNNPLSTEPGGNLNYSIYAANSLLQHQKIYIDWARMPGCGFMMLLPALFADWGRDFLAIYMNAILFQIVTLALGCMFFYWSASKIMHSAAALIVSLLILLLPHPMAYVQIENYLGIVVLFILGAGCLYIDAENSSGKVPSLRYHLLLHSGFALWFFIRPDIIPAWLLVSFFLYGFHRKTWAYLLFPVLGILAISIPWALYKQIYTHEFSLTTNTTGEVFFLGLWQVPNQFWNRLSDGDYYQWIEQYVHVLKDSNAGSIFALKEVMHFYVTYPVYVFSMLFNNLVMFLCGDLSYGTIYYSNKPAIFLLAISLSLSLCFRYNLRRLLLLGWALAFNLPLYFLMFNSCGRFLFPATASLMAAGVPLFFEKEFYTKILQRKILLAMILCVFVVLYKYGYFIDAKLLHSSIRYWAPFLDPDKSLIVQYTHQLNAQMK